MREAERLQTMSQACGAVGLVLVSWLHLISEHWWWWIFFHAVDMGTK